MDQDPAERPSASRRLERPPGERYDQPVDAAERATGSVTRAVAFAIPAAMISLFVYVGFAGPLAFSGGLVIVGIFAGRIVGLAARTGAGSAVPRERSVLIALGVTLAWFLLSQVAVWLYAQSEGGVLPIVDYLAQAFGPIVPLTGIAAAVATWLSAR